MRSARGGEILAGAPSGQDRHEALGRRVGRAPGGHRLGAFRTAFGGTRLHRSPALPAYAKTTAATRAAVESMDGTQPGDPALAARAILTLLDTPNAPLRLALGSDAVEAIRAHQAWIGAELDAWVKLSRSTDLTSA
ncbi:hypothetical protein [Dactylosporangium sp. CA-139066]|uniref:hypothetical protein n=1 Tax=Dactylosporangium sp. CA-139066 TaxID=3239930 RepID=UPI003D9469D2